MDAAVQSRRIWRDTALIVLIPIAIAAAWLLQPTLPTVQEIDGIYRNACCTAVTMHNGVISADGVRVPFELKFVKYDLTAVSKTPLGVVNGRIAARPEAATAVISFNSQRTAFTLCDVDRCGTGHEYVFSRT